MPFPQKSAMVMAGILVVVYGAYFAWMGWWQATTPVEDIPFQPLMILIVIPLVILAVAGQVILALFAPGDANAWDERDREIERRPGNRRDTSWRSPCSAGSCWRCSRLTRSISRTRSCSGG